MSWYPSVEVEDNVNDLNIESDGNIINNDKNDDDNINVSDDNNVNNDDNNTDNDKHDDNINININKDDNNDDKNKDDFDDNKNINDKSSQSLVQDIISEFSFQEYNTEIYELNDSNISENSNDNDNNADTSHECESVELLHSTCEFSLNANAPDFTFKQFDGYRGNSANLISSCLNSDSYRYDMISYDDII